MYRDVQKMLMLKKGMPSNLCAKLETDQLGGEAPWATEIYLPPPFSLHPLSDLGLRVVKLKHQKVKRFKLSKVLTDLNFCGFAMAELIKIAKMPCMRKSPFLYTEHLLIPSVRYRCVASATNSPSPFACHYFDLLNLLSESGLSFFTHGSSVG